MSHSFLYTNSLHTIFSSFIPSAHRFSEGGLRLVQMGSHGSWQKKMLILRLHPKTVESGTLGRGLGFCDKKPAVKKKKKKPAVILLDAQV